MAGNEASERFPCSVPPACYGGNGACEADEEAYWKHHEDDESKVCLLVPRHLTPVICLPRSLDIEVSGEGKHDKRGCKRGYDSLHVAEEGNQVGHKVPQDENAGGHSQMHQSGLGSLRMECLGGEKLVELQKKKSEKSVTHGTCRA